MGVYGTTYDKFPLGQMLDKGLRVATGQATVRVLPGCFVEGDNDRLPPDPVYDGTLVLDWTIDGTTAPFECRQSDAATLSVTIERLRGAFVGEYEQDCSFFATSIDLRPNDYVAWAVLLDPEGYERTTTIEIDPFTIYGDDVLRIPIDFPPDSFL